MYFTNVVVLLQRLSVILFEVRLEYTRLVILLHDTLSSHLFQICGGLHFISFKCETVFELLGKLIVVFCGFEAS